MPKIKCSDCQSQLFGSYPSWLRLVHMFEFLKYQELISETLYETCTDDLMRMKHLVDQHDEELEKNNGQQL